MLPSTSLLAGIALILSQVSAQDSSPRLPIVDLGYSRYRATALNDTGAYYNFSNIRYAAPPVGPLRFSDPSPPLANSTLQDGSVGNICFQALPGWWTGAIPGLGELLASFPQEVSSQQQDEDCLFLDVHVPTKIFNRTTGANVTGFNERRLRSRATEADNQTDTDTAELAPVLVNIHGGGFFLGDKRTNYDPRGLLQESEGGIVYLSLNYRLSAFGFLSGFVESKENTTSPNAGLLDQRFALKWVQKNIHLFGGDRKKVIIIGQSAGGGSVEFHTTAYGGSKPKEDALIAGAIAQSPAPIIIDPHWRTAGLDVLLEATKARSVDDLRKVPSDALQKASLQAQAIAPYSLEIFGPAIDGELIPDLPSRLYGSGKYNKGISVMASHVANEGRLFTNQSVTTNQEYDLWVQQNFASSTPEIWSYISKTLYTPVYNGNQPYTSPLERLELTAQETAIACNAVAVGKAYGSKAYLYNFGIPPAIHSQDLIYT